MTSPPDRLIKALWNVDTLERVGRVAEARGTLIRATGLNARMGEVCELEDPHSRRVLTAEVVGIERGTAVLAPLGPLEGLAINAEVVSKGFRATVGAGDGLLGRVVDALGNAIDGKPSPVGLTPVPVYRDAPSAMTRTPVRQPFHTGVRALDAVLTIAEGQRIGIFAAAGGGKSTLLGMLCRSAAEVNVIVLLGERACALREFIDDNLGAEGVRKSIIVVATSDRPALERSRAAHVGTAIAEYFRDQGKRVLLLLDSVTRFSRAVRDVGLAVGEPPARGRYPASVFSALPRLLERAGNTERGSITAFYTVLLDDEEGDPVGEEVRSILDGHVYLSRKLAAAHHFPAIDVLASGSRAMPRVAQPAHLRAAGLLRKHLAEHPNGAVEAILNTAAIRKLLQQPPDQHPSFDESVTALLEMVR
jgi:type III secretion protein N (ATPase)